MPARVWPARTLYSQPFIRTMWLSSQHRPRQRVRLAVPLSLMAWGARRQEYTLALRNTRTRSPSSWSYYTLPASPSVTHHSVEDLVLDVLDGLADDEDHRQDLSPDRLGRWLIHIHTRPLLPTFCNVQHTQHRAMFRAIHTKMMGFRWVRNSGILSL